MHKDARAVRMTQSWQEVSFDLEHRWIQRAPGSLHERFPCPHAVDSDDDSDANGLTAIVC